MAHVQTLAAVNQGQYLAAAKAKLKQRERDKVPEQLFSEVTRDPT